MPKSRATTEAIRAGEVPRLSGRLVLDEPLVIDRPMTLRGPATIEGATDEAVVVIRADVRFENVTIRRTGKKPGHVVVCESGTSAFDRVVLRGGVGSKKDPLMGCGVLARGKASASLVRCRLEDHGGDGALAAGRAALRIVDCTFVRASAAATDDASIEVEGSRFARCPFTAFAAVKRARGQARGCTFEGSAGNDLCASDRARVRFEKNVCRGARYSSLAVLGRSTAVLLDNQVSGSAVSGIYAEADAVVTAQGNVLSGNKDCGVYLGGRASGVVEGNACDGNRHVGIMATEQAAPLVTKNTCARNGLTGFTVAGRAAPRIVGNVAEDNEELGLLAFENAAPEVRSNTLRRNKEAGACLRGASVARLVDNRIERNGRGVLVREDARPLLRANAIERNSGQGILVDDRARPVIEANTVARNAASAIEYWDDAGGTAKGNRCLENEQNGIEVVGRCDPRLERNVCEKNAGEGIALVENVDDVRPSPVMIGNVCRDNEDDEPSRAAWPALRKAFPRAARPAWTPTTAAGDGPSGFGVRPSLLPGETWPACAVCRKPMASIVQLDLKTLPKEAGRHDGLLQLFCCYPPDSECWDGEGWHVARVVPRRGRPARPPRGKPAFPAKTITGWTLHGELPRWMERDGVKTSRVVQAGFRIWDGDKDMGDGPSADARLGDKLGGWACWIHDADRPACPSCRAPMRELLQVDDQAQVPWELGDAGVGWIFRCDRHPEAVAFGWQSH